AGVLPMWATRPVRAGDREELPAASVDDFFYRGIDAANMTKLQKAAKGFSHLAGLWRLLMRVRRDRPSAVHFQWTVLPPLDTLAILLLRRYCPVVLTVHDTVPFNGEKISMFQNLGFDLPIKLADRVIVHTAAGKQALVDRGVPAAKMMVVGHGPLTMAHPVAPVARRILKDGDDRWTFVAFGEIKPYKGVDLLVEAVAAMPANVRAKCHVIVAGRPRMDMAAITARIAELGLQDVIELRLRRQSEVEMATLFERADCFVFPYRQIDASGVYFLVKSLGRWLIASEVGVFAEDIRKGVDGVLLPPGDVARLSAEMQRAVETKPRPVPMVADDSWLEIGHITRSLYEGAALARKSTRSSGATSS
ncbi:MAG: hypothetical protein JWQ11_1582, partial [Rhizobacter sp.]|nr:hypothetical protein [Rhizobacter sp.]